MLSTRLKTFWQWLQYPVLLGLLVWLVMTARPALSTLTAHGVRWDWLLAGLVVFQIAVFLFAERYRLVLRASGIARSYGRVLAAYMQSLVYFFITPGGIGVEAVRFVRLRQGPEGEANATVLLFSMLLDRMLGMLAALVLAAYGIGPILALLGQGDVTVYTLLLAGVVVLALVLAALWHWQRTHIVVAAKQLWANYRQHKILLFAALGYSLLIQALVGLSVYLCAHAIGIAVDVPTAVWVTAASMALMVLPMNVGGFGLNDAGAAVLFTIAGVPLADATALALLAYTQRLWLGVQSGVLEFASKIVKTQHG